MRQHDRGASINKTLKQKIPAKPFHWEGTQADSAFRKAASLSPLWGMVYQPLHVIIMLWWERLISWVVETCSLPHTLIIATKQMKHAFAAYKRLGIAWLFAYGLKPEVWGRVVPDPRAELHGLCWPGNTHGTVHVITNQVSAKSWLYGINSWE